MKIADLLKVDKVTVHYEKAEAVVGISLEVASGTLVALIGPNGAGKSTLLRAISGLKALTSGQMWFGSTKIDGMSPTSIVRQGIAHVPEGRRLFPYMTVLHNLEMGAFIRKDKKEIKRDMDEIFGHFPILDARRRQLAGTLSGGEQQMLAIARGLMAKPKLLMLDEPSLGVSPLMVQEIEDILERIVENGVSILLVEQNAELALGTANKVYVMSTGRLVSEGDPAELSETEFIRKAYLGK